MNTSCKSNLGVHKIGAIPFHKSERAAQLVRQRGAWLLHLPPYSPDLNPIELAFSKLKALLRKRAARSFNPICDALKDICALFSPKQCRNFFRKAGHEASLNATRFRVYQQAGSPNECILLRNGHPSV